MSYARFRNIVFSVTGIGWAMALIALLFPAHTFDMNSNLSLIGYVLLVSTPLSVLVSIPPGGSERWAQRAWWTNALSAVGLVVLAIIAFGVSALALMIIAMMLDPRPIS